MLVIGVVCVYVSYLLCYTVKIVLLCHSVVSRTSAPAIDDPEI